MQNITLSVDTQAAESFFVASSEEKKKIQMLVSLLLKQGLQKQNVPSIEDIMDSMSDYAESKGLTDSKLQEILAENA